MIEVSKVTSSTTENKEGLVEIQFYTDPLCCWSWAFEPQWRRLRYQYRGKIRWRYRMAGLIPNWEAYSDPLNDVLKPVQMGPVWMEAKHISGMPMNDKIWFNDPPASSYPACIAVKAAGLQSPDAAEWYLRRVREAIMLQGRNIGKVEVLLEVAEELSTERAGILDFSLFEKELRGEAAQKAFEEDLRQVQFHRITRYPALTINKPGQPGLVIIGYRPFEALQSTLLKVAPELADVQGPDSEEYYNFWKGALPREVEEIQRHNGSAVPPQQ